jgi:hypothetical protein
MVLIFGSAKYILALWWECLTCAHALLRLSVRQSWLAPFFAVSLPKRFPEGCGHNRFNFALAIYLCLYLVDCTCLQSWSPDLSSHFSWPYGVNMKAPKVTASQRVERNSFSLLCLVRPWVLMNTAWVYLLFTLLQPRSTWKSLLHVHYLSPTSASLFSK